MFEITLDAAFKEAWLRSAWSTAGLLGVLELGLSATATGRVSKAGSTVKLLEPGTVGSTTVVSGKFDSGVLELAALKSGTLASVVVLCGTGVKVVVSGGVWVEDTSLGGLAGVTKTGACGFGLK